MESELRSGRKIGYIFAIPSSAVSLICLYFGFQQSAFWLLSAFFGFGAFIGFHLILRPRTLVKVNEGMLELYPGCLGHNTRQISIPLEQVEGFDVKTVPHGDGSTWLLSLYVREAQNVSEEARRWIRANVPKEIRDQSSDTTILWSLTWPEGGIRGAHDKMKQLTSRE